MPETATAATRLPKGVAQRVRVDRAACQQLGHLLSGSDVPADREDTALPALSRHEIGNFYLLMVALCHQTSPRGKPPLEGYVDGQRLRGWDYLTRKFEEQATADHALLTPERWATMSGRDIAALFVDSVVGERLTEPDVRAQLTRDLGAGLLTRDWAKFEDIYRLAAGRAVTGKGSVAHLLAPFRAYRDPLRKKSLLLLGIMRNTGLWEYGDADQVGSPVDYHEVRGHLRLGTVVVADEHLEHRLRAGLPVSEGDDLAIRSAVYDAIMLVSEMSGIRDPSRLHYMFWHVFRSCCSRDTPHCMGCQGACGLPARYVHMAKESVPRKCPFASICPSAGIDGKYNEHVFDTDYY